MPPHPAPSPDPSPDPAPATALPTLPAHLKALIDAALDCIIAIDTAGRVIEFNAAAERTFGYTRAAALGREMAELIVPPAMRARHRAGLAHMVASGTGIGMVGRRIEVHAMRADGSEFPVELTITKVEVGNEIFFTAYLREDIVARLQTRFTAILDAALDCIVTIDHAGKIVDFNAAAVRTFGYPRERALGREMAELIVPPSMRERHRAGLKRMVGSGKSSGVIGQRIEITALHADGHEFPVELAITHIDATGKEPFFTAYLRDLSDRRRAEAAQRESQAYFEKSFHSSPALMSIASAVDGKLIEINPAFARGAGYTREEAVGRTTAELGLWLRPDQRDEFLRRIRADRQIRDLEAEFRSQQGVVRTLLVNADLIELGGRPCILTVGIDITERRRRDQIQSATYAISQAALGSDDLLALLGEVHRILGGLISAKNFYVAMLNADRTLLSFPYFVDETSPHPPARPPRNGITEYVIETREPLLGTNEEIIARISGRGAYVPSGRPSAQWLGAPLLIEGRSIGVLAVQDYHNAHAYTEEDKRLLVFVAGQAAAAIYRREATTMLARAEARYRSIFENALEGLYVSSPEGRFLSANPALARMFGYGSAAEMLAAINDIKHQLYVSPTRRDDFFQLVHDSDEVAEFESEVYRRDRSTFWVSESVRVVRNAAGHVDHFEGVAADITHKREAARALQAAKDAADAASRSKSYFLASVSHELRTPLNGILGYTQILRRDSALTEKQREGVRVIHESADHLLALINDVLDLSKIEAGRIELHPADFDLPDFAASVERVFTPRARDKSLLFETALAGDLPRFTHGDEQRLRQVVFNLVANAVKFTTTGGVVFSVQRGEGDTIRFSVSDTGPGISEDDTKKLFEPFTQVGAHEKSATGTGLGLAISRSLVERMGGKLRVESKLGWGSRFWFEVPLPVAATPASLGSTAPMSARRVLGYEGARRRVLIVDDNATNRAVMTAMLAPLGFELTEVADGETSLVRTPEFQPDLVLMDLRLPGGIDGLEATRRLRQTEPGRAAKIIAVSASAYDLDRNECFAAGCDAFLAKPFREEELWTVIERALGLVWQFAADVADETRTPFAPAVLAPPAADLDALHELAAKGDVVGLRARAQALLERDPRLAPFAQSILDLAARFKMKAIRQFVARYKNTP
ncbi:MAG: hypothetical protein RLZZ15_4096 [Verrucomicrobiota bacterium]|jgi:PAS domain S-box-containing protein